jgi:hypothetical protein
VPKIPKLQRATKPPGALQSCRAATSCRTRYASTCSDPRTPQGLHSPQRPFFPTPLSSQTYDSDWGRAFVAIESLVVWLYGLLGGGANPAVLSPEPFQAS